MAFSTIANTSAKEISSRLSADNSTLTESLRRHDGLNVTSPTEELNHDVPCCSEVSFDMLVFSVSTKPEV